MKNCLVLGSAGQIGSALTSYLNSKNYNVLEFDITNNPLHDLRINNNYILREKLEQADFVYFLAFDVGGCVYLKKYQNTYGYIQNNSKIMVNTFELLKEYDTPFVFASSQMSNMSYSSYGVLKKIGEDYTKSLGGLVVKFWNVYGIEHNVEKSHVITDFIIKAKLDGVIKMLTDGTEYRQFLHSLDCSKALEIVAENYRLLPRSEELHIANFKWNSIIDVANIINEFIPCKIQCAKEQDTLQFDKRNEPDPYILNWWKPEITLKDGIKNIIDGMV